MTVKVNTRGTVKFRGFKSCYVLSWKDTYGKEQQAEFIEKMMVTDCYLPKKSFQSGERFFVTKYLFQLM